MKALTAKRAVLYQGRMYEPGDVLPAGDSRMVEAWLQAKSAEWAGEDPDPAQTAQEPAEGAAGGQESTRDTRDTQEGPLDVVEGHLTRESLETMTKADLEKLAKDMGVDIPRGATKALIVERLAAVTVEAPAPDGGAQ